VGVTVDLSNLSGKIFEAPVPYRITEATNYVDRIALFFLTSQSDARSKFVLILIHTNCYTKIKNVKAFAIARTIVDDGKNYADEEGKFFRNSAISFLVHFYGENNVSL